MEISGNGSVGSGSEPQSCGAYRKEIIRGLHPYEILSFLTPRNNTAWLDRSEEWSIVFKIHMGVLGAIYFVIAIASVFLIIKRDCARLKVKTFIAVYLTTAILGFSRGTFIILDPFGLIGFIANPFPQWVIISRFLASFGFPSLVASYTLVFMTLLKLTRVTPGKQWYQYKRYVVLICVTPYVIAVGAELIGHVSPYPGLLSIIVCEALFAFWGIVICITFLLAGGKLQRKIRTRQMRTVRRISVPNSNQSNPSEAAAAVARFERERMDQNRQIVNRKTRKIAIITYATAVFGLFYSFVTAGNLTMVCLLVYHECLGLVGRGNVTIWLVVQTLTRVLEIILAIVMLYSITDVPNAMRFVVLLAKCRCRDSTTVACSVNDSSALRNLHMAASDVSIQSKQTNTTRANSDPPEDSINEMAQEDLEAGLAPSGEAEELLEQIDQPLEISIGVAALESEDEESRNRNPKAFQIIAGKGDSASSIGTNLLESMSPTPTSSATSQSSIAVNDSSLMTTSTENKTSTDLTLNISTIDNSTEESRLMVTSSTQTIQVEDKSIQTEPQPVVGKPVPKPRRFAHKLHKESKRQKQLQALTPTQPKALNESPLKRKYTV